VHVASEVRGSACRWEVDQQGGVGCQTPRPAQACKGNCSDHVIMHTLSRRGAGDKRSRRTGCVSGLTPNERSPGSTWQAACDGPHLPCGSGFSAPYGSLARDEDVKLKTRTRWPAHVAVDGAGFPG